MPREPTPRPPAAAEFQQTPATPPPSYTQQLIVLAVCGLVVLLGASASRSTNPRVAPADATASASLPGPLPSGAPPRGLEDLPADDERAQGCHFVDHGFGDYGEWRRLIVGPAKLVWRALVPASRGVAADGSFRLLVHFHGAEPVRRQLAPEALDLVIVAIDAGVGSRAYDQALSDPALFDQVVAAVEREVAAANHLPAAHARSIVLSSWSAGYGAVARVLGSSPSRASAIVLMDSLYAGYVDDRRTLDRARLAPFLAAARAALAGGSPFFLTHTDIATPGYGSTSEVASYLLDQLGLKATPIEAPSAATDPYPLRRTAEQGHVWIRGYAGNDRDAHCAELHLLPSILREAILPGLP